MKGRQNDCHEVTAGKKKNHMIKREDRKIQSLNKQKCWHMDISSMENLLKRKSDIILSKTKHIPVLE